MKPAYLPERNLSATIQWQPRRSRPALELAAVCFGLGFTLSFAIALVTQ